MLEYAYYPGCSLEHTASPYDKSTRAVFKSLGIGLREIEDWNCCGATMYMSAKKIVGYSISARNLALAQEMGLEICAPCSSCYTILRKTNRHIAWDPKEGKKDQRGPRSSGDVIYQAGRTFVIRLTLSSMTSESMCSNQRSSDH